MARSKHTEAQMITALKAEEVKHLRDENARLKRLVADLSLDKDMLQSVIRKTP